ncbi:EF-P beta-lysylation protein EpmB [Cocleimonas sp. KMM 6892]|uniref:EF-P beta-lysylation protein EpmB n=1 Tax=unclassified Cocleimonas TaxID=2639732 RepID=UPI002DB91A93|nr:MULTISPECIES: EF-P beta-lysylation protein EpmB [unclassified Cocleimonas]MEB8434096.1 EF-P beta-lysylation protein EpmB [Cocleimonas sp. KMM 6892]MEC4717044.1 EF-P beta-lysylation protein EpmB [Cocleimonas sp. KMM 6895]MEC4746368.1 EF-P beta-lysylation protein EpmB [Cocleimonas sp. KMM 6896]
MLSSHPLEIIQLNNESNWRTVLKKAFKDPLELLEFLGLDRAEYLDKVKTDSRFKMLVPLSYAEKMQKGDWNDPLLQQVLPINQENIETLGFVNDPIGDLQVEASSGLLHKYQGRVLLVTTGACPVHCRYCFRREFPYADSSPDKKQWQNTLDYIQGDNSIHEVIFSGGDPLMLSDGRLQKMCIEITAIPHVKTLRFHTRVPVFLPERINQSLRNMFTALSAAQDIQKVMVIHINHANEIDEHVSRALSDLRKDGFTLLNQSVLLRGVNDDVATLSELSHKLMANHVLPYYLHQLDRIQGAAHFEVKRDQSIRLVEGLRNHLPGYLVPRLVEDISGERSKLPIEKNPE